MYGKPAPGVLASILGHVAYFCVDAKLPPLTSIVVGKYAGAASHGIPVAQANLDRYREKVYRFDWCDIYPPSADDLKASYDAHT
jgi:hypothetical protein